MEAFKPPRSSQPPADFGLRMETPAGCPHNFTPLTPISFLLRAALIAPDAWAIVHPERGIRFTYAEWAARCLSLAFAIKSTQGWSAGDRVAVITCNSPMILEAQHAVLAVGGIVTPFNTRNSPKEIAYVLAHSGAKLVLCDSESTPLLPSPMPQGVRAIICRDSGGKDKQDEYEYFLDQGWQTWQAAERSDKTGRKGWGLLELPADENAPAALCYTSGTTGKPKGVITTHRGTYLAAVANAYESQLVPGSVYLWILPLFHAMGWTFCFSTSAAFATNYILRKVDYAVIWKALINDGVTHYAGAPTVQIAIVNHELAQRLPRPVIVSVAASAPTADLLGRMESRNLSPSHIYGSTETFGPITRRYAHPSWGKMFLDERSRLMARQGHGFLTADEVRVVRNLPDGADPDTAPLIDVKRDGKELGEIIMRGNIVMKEYFNDVEATKKTMRAGWFCTGDLAVRFPGGEVSIQDRAKDLFISGGENCSSVMVEQELAAHADVFESSVVARKDEQWGEVGHAFVVLRANAKTSADDLRTHCRERMSKFAVPKHWTFVKELPKTSTGKVQKNVLRERVSKL